MIKAAAIVIGIAVFFAILGRFLAPTFPVHKGGVVLITGASTGIGRDAAVALHAAGYTVFAAVRRQSDGDALKSGRDERMRPILLDVTSISDIEQALQTIQDFLKSSGLPFAALVNNAGIAFDVPLEFTDPARTRSLFDVNVFGLMDITRVFIPLLRESKGRIVNIGSFAGLLAPAYFTTYSASKFAVSAISDSLRRELFPHGISVSEVNPAYVKTPIKGKVGGYVQLTEEQKALYNFEENERKVDRYFEKADTTEVTSAVILDAIANPSPRPRYVVANVDGIPAYLMALLAWFLPVELTDLMVRLF